MTLKLTSHKTATHLNHREITSLEGFTMITIPLKDIITKISQKAGISEDEVKKQIAAKVEQLYGLVSEDGAAHIIANEYGIKVLELPGDLKIKDILIGMRSVDVAGKVMRKYELREFATEKRKGKVANLVLGDETGAIRVVFWNDKTDDFTQIKEGDVIKIKSAYVRENMGRKELHLGDSAKIIINPADVTIQPRERIEYDRKHIAELQEGTTGEILGTIVQVFDIKFFEVCPQCNKRLRLSSDGFACDDHGKVAPQYNYVLGLYIDDGTGNIRVTFWKQQTQKLLKLSDAEVATLRNSPELFEKYKTDLLGIQVKVLGRVKNNITGRLEFTADLVYTDLDPAQETEMLSHAKEIALKTNKYDENPLPTATAARNDKGSAIKPAKPPVDEDEFEISEDFLEE